MKIRENNSAADSCLQHGSVLPLVVRQLLKQSFLQNNSLKETSWLVEAQSVERLNVTLRRNGVVRGSMSAPGSSLYEQLVRATQKASKDRRFDGEIVRNELDELSIEVWLQTSKRNLPLGERGQEGAIRLGVNGVEVNSGEKVAYYKPSVAMTSKHRTQSGLLDHVCKKAGLSPRAWQSEDVEVLVTTWQCWALDPRFHCSRQIKMLRDDFREPITPASFDGWINASLSYLVGNQTADGEIIYMYDTVEGRATKDKSNAVRTSGCFFALSTSSSPGVLADGQLSGVEYAVALLYRKIASRGRLWKEGTCRVILDEAGQTTPAKLGTTALFACGVLGGPIGSLVPEERDRLINTIKAVQRADGRFSSHIGASLVDSRSENYSSGQALLALALASEKGDTEALDRCTRAFSPYKGLFEKDPTTAFVGWHIDAWERIFSLTGNSEYADFVFVQADWLLQWLISNSQTREWIGGFSRNGLEPTASSIVFVEALCRATRLAEALGDARRVRRYADALRLSLPFCQKLRVESVLEIFRQHPQRTSGGIVLSMRDLRIRCDFVQHFITMCIEAKKIAHLLIEIN